MQAEEGSDDYVDMWVAAACDGRRAGRVGPGALARAPLCSPDYIQCNGQGNGTLVEGELGTLPAPGTQQPVPAVFNNASSTASLPGALGTRDCDCQTAYGKDTGLVQACEVCQALQVAGLCGGSAAASNGGNCTAPLPGSDSKHIRCDASGLCTIWQLPA